MSLLDEALEASQNGRYPVCSVAALSDDLRDEVEEALATPGVTAAGLSRLLRSKWDIDIKATTLRRHARGDCSC